MMWCFRSIEGYSKISRYIGNDNDNGPFIYTGFKPAFLLVKKTNAASDWHILNAKNSTTGNELDDYLRLNVDGAEITGSDDTGFDILSNGFKVTNDASGINCNGCSYIYMAFAEMPFKYGNAV